MRHFILLSSFLFAALIAKADASYMKALSGSWKYTGHFDNGHFQPADLTDFILTLDFTDHGHYGLRWEKGNKSQFCESFGRYEYDGQTLSSETVRVHPGNFADCKNYPIMSLGNKINASLILKEGQIKLEVPLQGRTLISVWSKIE